VGVWGESYTWTGAIDGDWVNPGNWDTASDGVADTDALIDYPGNTFDAVYDDTAIITDQTNDPIIAATVSNLAVLQVNAAASLDLTKTIDIGTIINDGILTNSFILNLLTAYSGTGTFTNTGLLRLVGTQAITSNITVGGMVEISVTRDIPDWDYENLTIAAGMTGTLSENIAVSGTLTNDGILDLNGKSITTISASALTNNGTLKAQGSEVIGSVTGIGGTAEFSGTGDLAGLTSFQNLTISGSGIQTADSAITVGGSLAMTAGTLSLPGGTVTTPSILTSGTIILTGANPVLTGIASYNDLVIPNGTTFTLSDTLTATGKISIEDGGIFNLNGENVAGNPDIQNDGTITALGGESVGVTPNKSNASAPAAYLGHDVILTGNGTGLIDGINNYYNVTINGGVRNIGANNLDVGGNLEIAAGSLTVGTTLVVDGALAINGGSVTVGTTLTANSLTMGDGTTLSLNDGTIGTATSLTKGTIILTGNGTGLLTNITSFNNLYIFGGTRETSMGLTVLGDLEIDTAGSLEITFASRIYGNVVRGAASGGALIISEATVIDGDIGAQNGTVEIASGKNLSVGGSWGVANGQLTAAGSTLNLTGTDKSFDPYGNTFGNVVVAGTYIGGSSGGTFASVTGTGSFPLAAGNTYNVNGEWSVTNVNDGTNTSIAKTAAATSTLNLTGAGTIFTANGNTFGNVTIDRTQDISSQTISVLGSVNITNVGTLTADGSILNLNGAGTLTSGGKTLGNVTIVNGASYTFAFPDDSITDLNNLTVNGSLDMSNQKVTSTGIVNFSGSTAVTATGSTLNLNGTVDGLMLNAGGKTLDDVVVGTGANYTFTGFDAVTDVNDLTVNGTLDISGQTITATGTVLLGAGAVTANGTTISAVTFTQNDGTINSTGNLTLTMSGAATQTVDKIGNITAETLILNGAGSYYLARANTSNTVGTLYTGVRATGGAITFKNSNTLIIGTGGIETNNAAINLETVSGDITINGPVDAGTEAASIVTLKSSGTVSQGEDGKIIASSLDVNSVTGIDLDTVANAVGTVSLKNSTDGDVNYQNGISTGLTIVVDNDATTGGVNITETMGSITIETDDVVTSDGNIVLNANGFTFATGSVINAGTTEITLNTNDQNFTLGANANLIASTVTIDTGAGELTIPSASNLAGVTDTLILIGKLSGIVDVEGMSIANLAVNSTGAGALSLTLPSSGNIRIAIHHGGDILLTKNNAGNVIIANFESVADGVDLDGIVTPNDKTVILTIDDTDTDSTADVTQEPNALVSSAMLILNGAGSYTLTEETNAVAMISTGVRIGGGAISFADADGFDIGNATYNGLSSSSDIELYAAGGNITMNKAISTTRTVRLRTDGSITQNAAATITAANLQVYKDSETAGSIILDQGNIISAIISSSTNAADVEFNNTASFAVDTIAASASGNFPASSGIITNGSDLTLTNTGAIAITQPVNTHTSTNAIAGTTILKSSGSITQSDDGTITTQYLKIDGTSANVIFDLTGNSVENLAAVTTGAALTFVNNKTLNIGTVDSTSGINTSAGAVTLTLAGTTGIVTQNDIGKITAASLVVSSKEGIDLDGVANAVAEVSLTNSTSGVINYLNGLATGLKIVADNNATNGMVSLTETLGNMTIDTVDVLSGISTDSAGVTLIADIGEINVTQSINTGTAGAVAITTNGSDKSISNSGSGSINTNGGSITLTADRMAIGALVNAGANTITARNTSNSEPIFLGGTTGTGLVLSNTSLQNMQSTTLRIGRSDASASGAIAIDGNFTLNNSVTTLALEGASISGTNTIGGTNLSSLVIKTAVDVNVAIGTTVSPLNIAVLSGDDSISITKTGGDLKVFDGKNVIADVTGIALDDGGTITLNSGGEVTQNADAPVNAGMSGTLVLNGTGSYILATDAAGTNTIGTLYTGVRTTGGKINFVNSAAFTVGTTGINTTVSDAPVTLATANTDSITLNGNITTAGSAVTVNDNVILGGNISITSTGGAITFAGSINDDTDVLARNLTLVAGIGAITVNGAVGTDTTRLGAMNVTSSGTVNFGNDTTDSIYAASFTQMGTGTTTFTGTQNYSGTFSFTGTNLTIGNTLTTTNDGDFTFIGTGLTVNGAMSIAGSSTVTNSGVFTTSAGIVSTAGLTQSGGGTNSLGANITTTNAMISFVNPVTLIDNVTITSSDSASAGGAITFVGSINDDTDVAARNLTLAAGSGTITVLGAVGTDTTRLGTLNISSSGIVTFGNDTNDSIYAASYTQTGTGTTTFSRAQDYSEDFNFTGTNLTIGNTLTTTNAGDFTFTGTGLSVNGAMSIAGSSTVTNGGAFTTSAAIVSTDGLMQSGGGTNSLGGNITTTNAMISFVNPVTLIDNVTITSSDSASTGGAITFAGSINDDTNVLARNLTLVAGIGAITVNGAVGTDTTRLGTLNISSAGTVTFSSEVNATSFDQDAGTGTTTFSGAQDYSGDFSFTGTDLTINGAMTIAGTTTVTNTGVFTASGVITSVGEFKQISTATTGRNSLGANITTTNSLISFASPVTLTANVEITSTGGAITFSGTVNGNQNLVIANGSGAVQFNGNVGPIGTTTGAALSITGDTNTSTITFTGTLTTNSGIYIAGPVTFNNDVTIGAGDASSISTLNSTVTMKSGLTNFNAGRNVTFKDEVTLETAATKAVIQTAASNGNITFEKPITSNRNLELVAFGTNTGDIIFSDAVTVLGTSNPALKVTANSLEVKNLINTSRGDLVGTNKDIEFILNELKTPAANPATASIDAGNGNVLIAPSVSKTIEYGDANTSIDTQVYYSSHWLSIIADSFTIGKADYAGAISISGVTSAESNITIINNSTIFVRGDYTATDKTLTLTTSQINIGADVNVPSSEIEISLGSAVMSFSVPVVLNESLDVTASGISFLSTISSDINGRNLTLNAGNAKVTFSNTVGTTGIAIGKLLIYSSSETELVGNVFANEIDVTANVDANSKIIINPASNNTQLTLNSNNLPLRINSPLVESTGTGKGLVLNSGTSTTNVNRIDLTGKLNIVLGNSGSFISANTIDADGGVEQTGASAVNNLAGNVTTANALISFASPVLITKASEFTFGTNTGIGNIELSKVTSSVDLTLNSGIGNIVLNGPVNVGTSTVTLTAATPGTVTQPAAVNIITAGTLKMNGTGSYTLIQSNNVGTITTGGVSTGAISFVNAGDLAVGDSTKVDATGNVFSNGDIEIYAVGSNGNIRIEKPISAVGKSIRLRVDNSIAQTGDGIITASNLLLYKDTNTTGSVSLNADNVVNVIASSTNVSSVEYNNSVASLSVGSLTASTVAPLIWPAFGGIATNGSNLTLTNVGTIVINQVVSTGTSTGTVVLTTTDGDITQTSAITTPNLKLVASDEDHLVNLNLAAGNSVTNLSAETSGAPIHFTNSKGLIIEEVSGTNGITVTDASVTLETVDGDITLVEEINVGTATTSIVTLTSPDVVRQTDAITTDKITANTLILNGSGIYTLTEATNAVSTITTGDENADGRDSGTGAAISFTDSDGFSVGTEGLTTSNAAVTLVTVDGDIALVGPINVGTAATSIVTLTSPDVVRQTDAITTDKITANTLILNGSGIYALTEMTNAVGIITSGGVSTGSISFVTAGDLAVGDSTKSDSTGNLVSSGDIEIYAVGSNGSIRIEKPISAVGKTVRLRTGNNITQTADGIITASNLLLYKDTNTTGSISLNADNVVNVIASSTNVSSVEYNNSVASLSVGSVSASTIAPLIWPGFSGIATNGSNLTLTNVGTIAINQVVSTGNSTGTVVLTTTGGDITQTSAITTLNLKLVASGNTHLVNLNLAAGNSVTNLATVTSGAPIHFTNSKTLIIEEVSGTNGITVTDASVTLVTVDGDIALVGPINVGTESTSIVTLTSPDIVRQTDAITANTLILNGSGIYTLTEATNAVSTITTGDENVGGRDSGTGAAISFVNTGSLEIGVHGITTNGSNGGTPNDDTDDANVILTADGFTFAANGFINVGNAAIELNTKDRNFNSNAIAVDLTAKTVKINAGNGSLTIPENSVFNFTDAITDTLILKGSPVTVSDSVFLNMENLAIASSNFGSGLTVTLGDGDKSIAIEYDGNITVTKENAGTLTIAEFKIFNDEEISGIHSLTNDGTLILNVDGEVVQSSDVTVTDSSIIANNLILNGTGSYTLDDDSNSVATIHTDEVITGAISFVNHNKNLIVDSDGIKTNANAYVNISTGSGNIAVTGIITAGTATEPGNVTLTSSGAVTQTGIINADELILNGANGTYTLNSANSVATIHTDEVITGAISFVNHNKNLIVDSDGIKTNANADVSLSTGSGNIDVTGIITAGTETDRGNVILQSSGTVTQTGIIRAHELVLNGTNGTYTLDKSNNIEILHTAAASTGAINFINIDAFAVGSSGIKTTGTNASVNLEIVPAGENSADETITLDGSIITIAAPIHFKDTISLGASGPDSIESAGGAITFSGTVNGNQNLVIANGTGLVQFDGAVGSASAVGTTTGNIPALIISGDGTIEFIGTTGAANFASTLNTNNGMHIAGDVTFNNDVTLGAGISPTSLKENVTITAVTNVTIDAKNSILFGDAADDVITINGSGANAAIQTSANNGSITFNGPVTAGIISSQKNLALQTHGTGTITFNNDLTVFGSSNPVLKIITQTLAVKNDTTLIDTSGGANKNIIFNIGGNLTTDNTPSIDAGDGVVTVAPFNLSDRIEYGDNNSSINTTVYYSSAWSNIIAGSFIVGGDSQSGDIYLSGVANTQFELSVKTTGDIYFAGDYTSVNKTINLLDAAHIVFPNTLSDSRSINLGTAAFSANAPAVLNALLDVTATNGISFAKNISADVTTRNFTLNAGSKNVELLGIIGSDVAPIGKLSIAASSITQFEKDVYAFGIDISAAEKVLINQTNNSQLILKSNDLPLILNSPLVESTGAGKSFVLNSGTSDIDVNEINLSGKLSIILSSGGSFTSTNDITAANGVEQIGIGAANNLAGNIATVNNDISFASPIVMTGTVSPLKFDTGIDGGNINLANVTRDANQKDLILAAGTGIVTLVNIGDVSPNGFSQIDISGSAVNLNGKLYSENDVTLVSPGILAIENAGGIIAQQNILVSGTTNINNNGEIAAQDLTTLDGIVTNSGTIKAGPLASNGNAIVFENNYIGAASGQIIGSPDEDVNPNIVFKENVTFNANGIDLQSDVIRFEDIDAPQIFKPAGNLFTGKIVINNADGVLITESKGVHNGELSLQNGTLKIDSSSAWLMSDSADSLSSAAGFIGNIGTLNFGDSSNQIVKLDVVSFITSDGFVITSGGTASKTVTTPGNVIIESKTADADGAKNVAFILTANAAVTLSSIPKIGNLDINSGAITLGNDLSVTNDVIIRSGTLDVSAANYQITLGRHWRQYLKATATAPDPFNPRNGIVKFIAENGMDSNGNGRPEIYVQGSTKWYQFVCDTPAPVEIKFARNNHAVQNDVAHVFINKFSVKTIDPTPDEDHIEDRTLLTRMMDEDYDPEISRLPSAGNADLPAGYGNPYPPSFPLEENRNYFWNINATASKLDFEDNVTVNFSWADPESINLLGDRFEYVDATPHFEDPNGETFYARQAHYCVGWTEGIEFIYSYTEDSDHNGRIDRIRVQASTAFAGEFDEMFAIEIDGYKIKNYGFVPRHDGVAPLYNNMFYIYIEEKPYADGGNTLTWRLVENNEAITEIDTGLAYSFKTYEDLPMDTIDTTWPIVNYSLVLPKNENDGTAQQLFIQFSEPVLAPSITAALAVKGITALSHLAADNNYASEYLVKFDETQYVSVQELKDEISYIINNALDVKDYNITVVPHSPDYPLPIYPVDETYESYITQYFAAPLLDNPATNNFEFRMTDVLISVPPANAQDERYFAWPFLGTDNMGFHDIFIPGRSNVEWWNPSKPVGESDLVTIRKFDKTLYLRDTPITLNVKVNPDFDASPDLIMGVSVPPAYRVANLRSSQSLWLPYLSGLVPSNGSFGVKLPSFKQYQVDSSSSNNLVSYVIGNNENDYHDKDVIDFYFQERAGLAAGRLDIAPGADIPDDWYRRIKPFSFTIREMILQRGGATILNNVINPTKGEKTYLNYTLTRSGQVTAQVFTLDGTLVQVLYRGSRSAGSYVESWDGKNRGGRAVARGMYFIRIVGPDIDEIRKVMVVK
jgi:hypothetical protein